VMFVGEQPGNQEDVEGKPFVGPAGKLLDAAFIEAGVRREGVYVTNVVKHFKWEPRGKRRIHKRPDAAEIAACRPWLDAENLGAPSANHHLPGSHRGAGPTRTGFSSQSASWGPFEISAGASPNGHSSSVIDIAGPRQRN
jgi:hypothetical protein